MSFEQIEHFFGCPYCNASISVLIDPSIRNQQYIEDCEVCCNPIEFEVLSDGENLGHVAAKRQED
jgi:transcription elongation factor Elf1